ncbi:MAG: helix-turn-helix domain-containing protein [Acidobacteriota bacterium]|nr:helix-turn-helix domain-containing protein [Acidobacteriota bacterium]
MKTLKELREEKGLTQAGLAHSSGVSLSWIRVIEQGGAGEISENIKGKIIKVLKSVPKEFQLKRALRKEELFTESNPILKDPVRLFVISLQTAAEKAGDGEAIRTLRECRNSDFFLTLQRILFLAKEFKIKLPRV